MGLGLGSGRPLRTKPQRRPLRLPVGRAGLGSMHSQALRASAWARTPWTAAGTPGRPPWRAADRHALSRVQFCALAHAPDSCRPQGVWLPAHVPGTALSILVQNQVPASHCMQPSRSASWCQDRRLAREHSRLLHAPLPQGGQPGSSRCGLADPARSQPGHQQQPDPRHLQRRARHVHAAVAHQLAPARGVRPQPMRAPAGLAGAGRHQLLDPGARPPLSLPPAQPAALSVLHACRHLRTQAARSIGRRA